MATVQDVAASVLGHDIEALRARYRKERDRRIRPEGTSQYLEAQDDLERFSDDPWAIEHPEREPMTGHSEVLVAGGGFGGLLMGARLRQAGIDDFKIIEEAEDFGGTWYWNRYPGAMCDIESLIYLPLLEELNRVPKHRYALQPEIYEHCQIIGQHYELYDRAIFSTRISDLRWNDETQLWDVVTNRGDNLTARHVVLACGRQSLPKLPNIPGIRKFKGHTFHSSRWDYKYTGGNSTGGLVNLKDKRVGIVGTAATAVQIVPHLGEWSKETYVFQRTPSSVGVRGNRDVDQHFLEAQEPGWQSQRMMDFTEFMAMDQRDRDPIGDGWTEAVRALTLHTPELIRKELGHAPAPEEAALIGEIADFHLMNSLRDRIDFIVTDPEKADKLKPWYRWACKRPCFHDDYLQTFNRINVHLIDTDAHGVQAFTENAVVVNGKEYEVDCVVFATGFESGISYTHLTGFEIYGRNGLSLSDHWRSGVRTLHGMYTDEFPNLFFMGGNPQTAAAVNAVHLLDQQAMQISYIMKVAKERGAQIVEADRAAGQAWADGIREHPKNRAQFEFFAECTPGYYNNEGQAKSSEDLFQGGRFGDGPGAYFRLLADWRAKGDHQGINLA